LAYVKHQLLVADRSPLHTILPFYHTPTSHPFNNDKDKKYKYEY
jgi:hypothetical protein